jgi:TrmH family RNA methyltransferase
MLSHNQLKFLTALSVKKYRYEHRKFLVEGEKMVDELLSQHLIQVFAIYALEHWVLQNEALCRPFAAKITIVTATELKKISALTTPHSVLAVAEMPPDTADLVTDRPCLYLDGIQDPGNMGTILRTADWFGFSAVYCSADCADAYSPKTIQAGMGAFLRVHTQEMPLEQLLAPTPHRTVWGAVLGGESIENCLLSGTGIMVIGNEGRGIRPETERLLTHRITIPRHPGSRAESLNAAVAAAILMSRFKTENK